MSLVEFPVEFPRLETERLILQELTSDDSEAIFQNFSDEDVTRYFMAEPFTRLEQAQSLVEAFIDEFKQGKSIMWVLVLKGSDVCIGTCNFMVQSSSCVEMGYDLAKAHWGKGLMSEATSAIIDYGFSCLGCGKIEADTMSHNARSINLLQRLGFRLDDVRKDGHYFSLLKESWSDGGVSP